MKSTETSPPGWLALKVLTIFWKTACSAELLLKVQTVTGTLLALLEVTPELEFVDLGALPELGTGLEAPQALSDNAATANTALPLLALRFVFMCIALRLILFNVSDFGPRIIRFPTVLELASTHPSAFTGRG